MLAVTDRRFDELSARDWHDIIQLRSEVFVVEQECLYQELDGRDPEPGVRHLWIVGAVVRLDHVAIAAYARAIVESDGSTRIGRVVTHRDARGQGLAGTLLDHILASTPDPWVLHSQSHLTDWYEQRGFHVTGAEFVEDGIPHVPMRRVGSGQTATVS